MRDYLPHPEHGARVLDAAVRPLDLNVIEQHVVREQPRLAHVRSRADPLQLKLRGAVAREVLAVAAAVLDDAETVAPFLAVPAEWFALVDETSAIDRRHSELAHRGDVDPRERLEQRAEDRLVERWGAPKRTELENGFEHDTALKGRRAKRAAKRGQARRVASRRRELFDCGSDDAPGERARLLQRIHVREANDDLHAHDRGLQTEPDADPHLGEHRRR